MLGYLHVRLIWVLISIFCLSLAQAAPQVESWLTDKGAKVIYVQADAIPMLDIRMVFDAGSARDGQSPGLASLTNALLTEGSADWDASQLAARLEDRGIQLGSGSLRDMAWLSIRTLTEPESLATATDVLGKIAAQPRFDDDAIERVRQQVLISLRQADQSPSQVATKRFYRTLYADHPYAHPPNGTEQSIQQIVKNDLVQFHHNHYVAANVVIAMVGAVDRQQAEHLVEQLTTGMAIGQHATDLPSPPVVKGGELRQSFPSSQSHLYLGQLGVARHDPDYFPLYVGNHILGGGGLVSILGEEVRNQRGLSYGVYSYFSPMRATGPFLMVAQTKNKQVDKALTVMRGVLDKFIQEGPTAKQIEEAKRNIIGGFPLKVASNRKIVEYIAAMGFYDLPLDWLDTLTAKVDAVTLEQIRDAFARRIDPARNVTVVVGGQAELH